MEEDYLTITQITKRIKKVINMSPILKNVYLKGEISKLVFHSNGNIYIDLKDELNKINCVIFPRVHRKMDFELEEGMHLLVRGTVDLYPKKNNSSYQFRINSLSRDGLGQLYIDYLKLKKKLDKKGYFDQSRKRPIPKFPQRIGVVTSPTGDAIKDILKKIESRWPLCQVILFPSYVEGSKAKDDIARQIKRSEDFNLDLLIVGRGGGSPESLWAFNEEIVADAIYNCPIPVISAVGHQNDRTISDDVADLRALTPTDAGEKAVPDIDEIRNQLKALEDRLNSRMKHKLDFNQKHFENVLKRPIFLNPHSIHEERSLYVDILRTKLSDNSKELILTNRKHLEVLRSSFVFKDPSSLLAEKDAKYNALVSGLKIHSKSFMINKERDLDRYKDSFVLKNPDSLIRAKRNEYSNMVFNLEIYSKGFISDKKRNIEKYRESFILKNPNVLFKTKSKDFNQLLYNLESHSRNFISNKERKLEKYKFSFILNNPQVIIKEKSRDYKEMVRDFEYYSNRLLESKEDDLKEIKSAYIIKNPNQLLTNEKTKLVRYMDKLTVLNPLETLKRGYTIAKHDDKVISSKKDLEIGDEFEVEFDDGSVNTRVIDLNLD